MKKVFTLMLALFAMVAVQAQVLLSEDFENGIPSTWLNIDADNDNFAWMEGTAPGVSGHNSSNGCAYSCSYYDGSVLTPDNWLITPAVNLTSNATLTFWVAAQDASWAAEHYGVYISTTGTATSDFTLLFEETIDANGGSRVQGTWKQKTVNLANYTGQTVYIAFRHFNCTDMFYIDLDDVEINAQPTTPTIAANPSTVNFGTTMLGNTANTTVNVTTYNLTSAVTATTAAPFSVSADGTTYGTSASIASTGGTLYLRYTPTAVGMDNGTVTLSSNGATDVFVPMTGVAMDCSNTLIPYSYSFDDLDLFNCWQVIDANGDDHTFTYYDGEIYYPYNSSSAADDWLISPSFNLTGEQLASFDYSAASTSYPEKFQVFAFGADTVALTGVITVNSTTYQTQFLDLSTLTGAYSIAIHCVSDADEYRLYITNFQVLPSGANLAVSTDSIDFGIVEMGGTSVEEEVVITGLNLTDPVTVIAAAPFEISADGTTYGSVVTYPATTGMVVYDTLYVRFAPTAAGTFNQNVTVSAGTLSETIALTGESVDCTPGILLPYVNNFNTEVAPPVCWSIGNDPEVFFATSTGVEGDYAIGIEGVDMLITPEIHANSAIMVSFDYINYFGTQGTTPTYFHVGYSTTDNNPSSITWLGDNLCAVDEFTTFSTVVPEGTKYVAIGVSELGSGLYWGMFELDDAFYIDNFSLTAQTEPLLMVSPESLSFGSITFGATTPVKTASVVGALLTSDINVTAPANFEVSVNGTSFASTTTLPQTGGTLYVRYNPSAAGTHTGNITITSGTASKTISVYGSAMDCSSPMTLPFSENFENGMPACWTILDQDGDGYSWEDSYNPVSYYSGIDFSGEGNNGSDGFVVSGSYSNALSSALTPDNWLITPALVIPSNGAKLTWYVAAIDADYAEEYYDVMLSTSLNPSTFTSVFNETLQSDQWEQRTVNINGNYAGQNVYVAFRNHNTEDIFLMRIDDISVTALTGVESHELNTTIFPNPANNVLNINANCNINRVEVYNMMGQMIGTYDVNDVNTQISTTALANGVYTVKIATENGTTTKKFTVAR